MRIPVFYLSIIGKHTVLTIYDARHKVGLRIYIRYTLFVNIEGKSAKIMTFRVGTEDDSAIKPVTRIAGASFTVKNSLPQALTITVIQSAPAKFAVMDLQGRVVRQGALAGAETVVPNLKPGSYIVKVARETRRVNVR